MDHLREGLPRTDSLTFGVLLTAFLLIVTTLSYLTVLTLEPVLQHLRSGT
jgi:K+-transporting ATPase A subunit